MAKGKKQEKGMKQPSKQAGEFGTEFASETVVDQPSKKKAKKK